MVFNAIFNNISVISWQSVFLVEKTTDLPQVADKLSHNVVTSTPRLIQALQSLWFVIYKAGHEPTLYWR
jgi:hypothetical protein